MASNKQSSEKNRKSLGTYAPEIHDIQQNFGIRFKRVDAGGVNLITRKQLNFL